MANVRALFSELFAYVLLFKQTYLQGEYQPLYDQVRRDIAMLLNKQQAAAKRQGMLEADYQDACFAAIAWADETILEHATWQYHQQWNAFPLQLEYYQTTNAGEEFFEKLEKLRTAQQDIREIYYLCLGLGFSGRYFLGLEDELKLTQIRREQAQRLSIPLENLQKVDRIIAQPYEVPPSVGTPITTPWFHLLLKAGLALLVCVPLLYFLWWVIPPSVSRWQLTVVKGGSGSGTVTSVPDGINCGLGCGMAYASGTKVTLKAVPDPGSVFSGWSGDTSCTDGLITVTTRTTCTATFTLDVEAIRKLFPSQLCARPSVNLQAGIIDLGGFVVSKEQSSDFRKIAENIKGITQVREKFDLIPRAFCEVVELLEPFKKQSEDQGFTLDTHLNKAGSIPEYYNQERLLITGKAPTKFASYVYVDYYAADGTVGHVFPIPTDLTNRFASGQVLQLPVLEININPAGLELVTVIASKNQLFVPPRYNPEQAEAYVKALRQVLLKDGVKPEVAATFHFLRTR